MIEFYPYRYKGYPKGLKYPWIFTMPSEKERDIRWQAIRRSMRKHHLDCLIVGGPWGYMTLLKNPYIYYISNYVPFVNTGTFVVFPLEGEPQLGVNNSIGPQFLHCALETSWMKEVVGSLDPVQDIVKKVKQLKLENGKLGIVGYNLGAFPASAYSVLRESFPNATFEDTTAELCEAMDEVARTSEEELIFLRKAADILDKSYEAVAEALRPGVREYELWAAAEQAIINNEGWFPSFMIVTSGPSPTFLRAPASNNVLSPGDVVMFEINSIYGGTTLQIAYALSLGRPRIDVEKMFEFCKELYDFSLVELEKKRIFIDVEMDLAQRIHAAGYEPMTPQIHGRNWSESKVTSITLNTEDKIEWGLLKEHLKPERSWRLLDQWKKALATHLEARIATKRKLANLLQEKTEYQLVDLPISGSFLYSSSVDFLFQKMTQRLLQLADTSDLEKNTIADAEKGNVRYGASTILAHAPGKEKECRQHILEALDELLSSNEAKSVIDTYLVAKDLTIKVRRIVEEISLLGLVPGQCRVCRRLGM